VKLIHCVFFPAPAWCYKFALPLENTVYQGAFLIKVKRVNVDGGDLVLEEMKGYIRCVYVNDWWVACVLEVDEGSDEVLVYTASSWPLMFIQIFTHPKYSNWRIYS